MTDRNRGIKDDVLISLGSKMTLLYYRHRLAQRYAKRNEDYLQRNTVLYTAVVVNSSPLVIPPYLIRLIQCRHQSLASGTVSG